MKLLLMTLTLITGFAGPLSQAFAQGPSHAYINNLRSSAKTHYYVTVGIDAEFGSASATGELAGSIDGEVTNRNVTWQGQGMRNEIGIEYLKFIQFSGHYTSINLRNRSKGSESLNGGRFGAGVALNFYGPLGNLRLGANAVAGKYDYTKSELTADYVSSGLAYKLGYNYFLSSRLSLYTNLESLEENLTRNGGNNLTADSFEKRSTIASLGFHIWM